MPPIIQITSGSPVASDTTPLYTAVLVDPAGHPISGAALDTLTLSIVDTLTGVIINGVSQTNILNTDRGTIDSQGKLSVQLRVGDTSTDELPGVARVLRSLVFDWTYQSGTQVGRHQANFVIDALAGP